MTAITVFATLDGDGAPVELAPGRPFVTYTQRVDTEEESIWSGLAIGGFAAVECGHAPDTLAWPDDLLARYGIQKLAFVVPDGQLLVGYGLALADGVITVQPTYEATPAAPRRLVPKSVIQERLNTAGKLEAALAALDATPILFARWFAPDWPNVYCDDAGLLAVLAELGCSADQIAEITAA